jgi:hypothetical protein
LESNFGLQASLVRLPFPTVRVVMMAMSCVFCDSAPQGEKNKPPLYMRITARPPADLNHVGLADHLPVRGQEWLPANESPLCKVIG